MSGRRSSLTAGIGRFRSLLMLRVRLNGVLSLAEQRALALALFLLALARMLPG